MKITLSIVVPCYNEEQVLPNSIPRMEQAVAELQETFSHADNTSMTRFSGQDLQIDYELVFVNDGSSDRFEL